MKNNKLYKESIKITNYLSRLLSEEGLKDPLEGRVIKNGYGNSFYALACLLRYKKTKDSIWKIRALKALNAEINIIKNRAHINKDVFRWEFKNYALIQSYLLIKDELDKKTKSALSKTIISWSNLDSYQTNWLAMRALNYKLRYNVFKKILDSWRSGLDLKLTLRKQTKEGFFPDEFASNSFQYHAYILALLFQYYELTGDKKVRNAFLKGVEFIKYFISPDGNFNYYGRGKKQIFGYASSIFALAGAYEITNKIEYAFLAKRVFSYTRKFKGFPIVLGTDESKREGWYAYNNKSDYLGFAAVYYFYAGEILKDVITKEIKIEDYEKNYPSLGLSVRKKEKNFICSSKKGVVYSYPQIKEQEKADTSSLYIGPFYRLILYNMAKVSYRGVSLVYKLLFKPKDFILIWEYYKSKKGYYSKGRLKRN
ncbi:MAG: hypothetical protein HQ541_20075 [Mariniphaga sp.]|nr:hypothetical protein [Mariniphaga sp.]